MEDDMTWLHDTLLQLRIWWALSSRAGNGRIRCAILAAAAFCAQWYLFDLALRDEAQPQIVAQSNDEIECQDCLVSVYWLELQAVEERN